MAVKHIRDLMPAAQCPAGRFSRFDEYYNILLNAVAIDDLNGDPLPFFAQRFIKEALFDGGAVGYDKITNKWYHVIGEGRNDYGDPLLLTMYTANGKTFRREAYYDADPDGAYIIKALPTGSITFTDIIKQATDFMSNCDNAMAQNLEACKTPYIVVCKNKDVLLSLKQAMQQKQSGQAALIVSEELGDGLKGVNIETPFLVDRFSEARDKERDTLLNKLGILTSNVNKKERVQSAEVNATLDVASDYIYMLIDTFNQQAKTYGIDAEMRFNGSMEEYYINQENSIGDVNVNDAERPNND